MASSTDVEWISDDELAALALAADPDPTLDEFAEPFDSGEPRLDLLPAWYMPAPAIYRPGRGRRAVIAVVVGALVLLSSAGLCVTYGFAEIAW